MTYHLPSKRPLRIIVTAGPTIEPIDPVRFISNYSTGLVGYEIAKEAKKRGHSVILISGPTHLAPPKGVKFLKTTTAIDMLKQVKKFFAGSDCLIMAAAIADWRPVNVIKNKMKRGSMGRSFCLKLKENPDILYSVSKAKGNKIMVGFALETDNLFKNAASKIKNKNLDLIVANKLTIKNNPFGRGTKEFYLIDKFGDARKVPPGSKAALAKLLLDSIEKL